MSGHNIKSSPTTVIDAKSAPVSARAWRDDAAYFSNLSLREGWPFACACACSVQPDLGRGNRNERSESGKVSASQFARAVGTSVPRVIRYLAIWEAAAKKGYVQPAATLIPGTAERTATPTDFTWKEARALAKMVRVKRESPVPYDHDAHRVQAISEIMTQVNRLATASMFYSPASPESREQMVKCAEALRDAANKIEDKIAQDEDAAPEEAKMTALPQQTSTPDEQAGAADAEQAA